ncbi:transcription factor HES-5-like [Mobula birostris]|uniref:transcription factor HES-5-like n=1 Tax=Mobula birostris TaxID=1983395 RepID=UPI003B27D878
MSPGTAAGRRLREGTKPRVSCREPCGLMKPAVEKRRRDRIHRSIVQLKGLLEREFHSEPNYRLEKAEILERCVSFLRHHHLLASRPPYAGERRWPHPVNAGGSRYLVGTPDPGARTAAVPLGGGGATCPDRDSSPHQTTLRQLAAKEVEPPSTGTLWRPWQF